jgi:uncharacterized protein YwqG
MKSTYDDEWSGYDDFPFDGCFPVTPKLQNTYVNLACEEEWDDIMNPITKKVFGCKVRELPREVSYSLYNKMSHMDDGDWWHKSRIGGYPYFAQNDTRGYHYNDYDLLLQIDSYGSNGNIMWADSGIAHFFIKKSDLGKLDFNNVKFEWDCY